MLHMFPSALCRFEQQIFFLDIKADYRPMIRADIQYFLIIDISDFSTRLLIK